MYVKEHYYVKVGRVATRVENRSNMNVFLQRRNGKEGIFILADWFMLQ